MKGMMGTCLVFLACQALGATQAPQSTERASQRMAELLDPGNGAAGSLAASGPMSRPGPRAIEEPAAPIPVYRGTPPAPDSAVAKVTLPANPRENTPLVQYRAQPKPPGVELPARPLVKLPSLDVESPIPLPILAKPQSDRVSLADPTLEASVAAALTPVTASRTTPVPFAAMNLPDPFEHSQAVRLRFTPDESPMPQSRK